MITYASTTLTCYNSLINTEVYYYQSVSPTELLGGEWATEKPDWEDGKYVWQKIRMIYEDGTYTEGDAVNITGQQGSIGTAAYSYKLNASDTIIIKSQYGDYYTDVITFDATYKQGSDAITPYLGIFVIQTSRDGRAWNKIYTSSENESSVSYEIPEDILLIKCTLYQGDDSEVLLDQMTVPIITEGTDGISLRDWMPIYLASDEIEGVTIYDYGWSRYKPTLDYINKYLWIYYVSRYTEGNADPELFKLDGGAVTFVYHGQDSPLENVKVEINPVQEGEGDPSLGNIRPVTGWTTVTINKKKYNIYAYKENHYEFGMPEDAGTIDETTFDTENEAFSIDGTTLDVTDEGTNYTYYLPESAGTVYGGVLDITNGQLTVTYGCIQNYNNEPLTGRWYSDRDVYTSEGTPTIGAQVVYELETPVIYQTTPLEVLSFSGSNTFTANTGDIHITYYDNQTVSAPHVDYSLASAFDLSKSKYGTSLTLAGQMEKVVECEDFILYDGVRIQVLFSCSNVVSAPTLNVNQTGAKSITLGNTQLSDTNALYWGANAEIEFVFNGTNWVAQNIPYSLYGTCNTGEDVASKEVTCDRVIICKGTIVTIDMVNTNTAANATLNVGSTIAKDIYANNARLTVNSRFNWRAHTVQKFVFDGRIWRMDDDSVKALATAYITEIDDDGIMVHPENDNTSGWAISDAIQLFKNGISYIKMWLENNVPKIRIGKNDLGHILLDNDSVDIKNGNTTLASFGETVRIGQNNKTHLDISSDGIYGQDTSDDSTRFFEINRNGATETENIGQGTTLKIVEGGTTVQGSHSFRFTSGETYTNMHISLYPPSNGNPYYNTIQISNTTTQSYTWTKTILSIKYTVEIIIYQIYSNRIYGRITFTREGSTNGEARLRLETTYQITSIAPTYTFGKRIQGNELGRWSVVEGYSNSAEGYASHAEGQGNKATGRNSHVEGYSCEAIGAYSHAGGYGSSAIDDYTFVHGRDLIGGGYGQITLGHCNADNYRALLVLGNGGYSSSGDIERSNALVIDWAGDVQLALDTAASSGTEDANLYSVITTLGWQNDVIV